MYRPVPSPSERAATVTAVVLVHAFLLSALLNLSSNVRTEERDALTQLIAIAAEPPPPPVVELQPQKAQPKKKVAPASAKNIQSQATPVAAPKPVIPVPTRQPIVASPTPRTGTEATQGASSVVGPGTGAGGVGNGTGSGGLGNGNGGGGDDGIAAVRARLATPPLRGRDFPRELLSSWPRGADIFTRLRVDPDGIVVQCEVMRGSGYPGLDAQVCAIIQQRSRFTPGLNRKGQRVADWFGYRQEAPR